MSCSKDLNFILMLDFLPFFEGMMKRSNEFLPTSLMCDSQLRREGVWARRLSLLASSTRPLHATRVSHLSRSMVPPLGSPSHSGSKLVIFVSRHLSVFFSMLLNV